jgi:hypothetical protein
MHVEMSIVEHDVEKCETGVKLRDRSDRKNSRNLEIYSSNHL